MDGSPIEAAYTFAKRADRATLTKDYAKAVSLHVEASKKFAEAAELTQSREAAQTLNVISRQHLARSRFLADLRNEPSIPSQVSPPSTSPGSSITEKGTMNHIRDDLGTSLAAARTPSDRLPGSSRPDEDPFHKFYAAVNSTFAKSFQVAAAKEAQKKDLVTRSPSGSGGAGLPAVGNESFYVVPNSTSLTTEELIAENASLRQMINRSSVQLHAYETALRKQKDAIKNSLAQLRRELAARESARAREQEAELETLRVENDKLKIQIGRLKSRWDELKESARRNERKRDDST